MAKVVTFTAHRTGDKVPVRSLISTLERALVWLRGRDPDTAVDWTVIRVSLSSSVSITLRSEGANGEISERMRSLSSLQKAKEPHIAPRLTDDDIDGTKQLAEVIGSDFSSMRISSEGDPTVRLTPALVERVERIAKASRTNWYEWTTLRGVIDQITAGQTMYRFRLRHQMDNSEINCDFDRSAFEEVKDALSHRVEIYGKVKYGRADQPKSVAVETIRRLPDKSPLFETVPAIDITSGMGSADYVERVRGGE